jgi:hypothetical protein
LARSRSTKPAAKRRFRYLAYGIPLLALAIAAGVLVVDLLPVPAAPAVMDYTFKLLVETTNQNGTLAQARAPKLPVGEPGGYWATSQYNAYGVDSRHYPLYLDDPSVTANCPGYCVIHVKSRVAHNYTLGDYFAVWGQPLGMQNTVGIAAYQNFAWQMCIGLGSAASNSDEWGAYVLQPDVEITLMYHDQAGLGCSPS